MMGALKNHRDERISLSVEELVPQEHFVQAIEATISFDGSVAKFSKRN